MSLRKTELLTIKNEDGSPGLTFTFQRLTFAQELRYRTWCEKKRKQDASAGMLSDQAKASGCGLTDAYGASQVVEGEGMRVFLKLASETSHPDMTDEMLYDLQADYYMDLLQIVLNLVPIGQLIIANMPDKLRGALPNLKGPV